MVAQSSEYKIISPELFERNRPVAVYWEIPLSAATISHLHNFNCVDFMLVLIAGGNVERNIV